MFLCGAEEPMVPNAQVYELNEETGKLELGSACIANANRYSFVWLGSPGDAAVAHKRFLQEMLRDATIPATWCAVWMHHHEGDLAGQSRTTRWQHQRHGWDTLVEDGLGVAVKSAAHATPSPPWTNFRSRIALMLGAEVNVATLANGPLGPTLRLFARARMAPSREAILWLARTEQSILHQERDDLGRTGLLCVGARRIPVDELQEAGLVKEIRRNELAATVWRSGP